MGSARRTLSSSRCGSNENVNGCELTHPLSRELSTPGALRSAGLVKNKLSLFGPRGDSGSNRDLAACLELWLPLELAYANPIRFAFVASGSFAASGSEEADGEADGEGGGQNNWAYSIPSWQA